MKKEQLKLALKEEKQLLQQYSASHDRLLKKADDLALKAERESKISYISESNVSRKRALEVKELADKSSAKIIKLQSELID